MGVVSDLKQELVIGWCLSWSFSSYTADFIDMSKYCMVAPSNHFDHCMVATVKLEQLAFFLCFAPPSLPGNVPLVEVVFFQRFASPSPCLPHWLDVHGTLCGTLGQFVYFLWRCPSASSVHRILLHLVLAFPPLSASPTTSPWVAHWTLYSPMCTLR